MGRKRARVRLTGASCQRCGRALRADDLEGWNAVYSQGVIVGYVCPGCQTAEESAEAVINESTNDYGQAWQDSQGRWRLPDPFDGSADAEH